LLKFASGLLSNRLSAIDLNENHYQINSALSALLLGLVFYRMAWAFPLPWMNNPFGLETKRGA
jgi:hypothetical protein